MAAKDVIEMVKTIDERAEAARERKQSLGSEVFAVLKEMNAASGEYDGNETFARKHMISLIPTESILLAPW